MSKAVVIGYREDILPFVVWGMELMPVTSPGELVPLLDKVLNDATLGLIIISEAVVAGAGLKPASPDILSSYMAKSPIPILVLPTHRGSYGTSLNETAAVIRKAIGMDILEGRIKV
jgi:vacuolar-type H+-ATPase subunit F/Vma7